MEHSNLAISIEREKKGSLWVNWYESRQRDEVGSRGNGMHGREGRS